MCERERLYKHIVNVLNELGVDISLILFRRGNCKDIILSLKRAFGNYFHFDPVNL